jgi:lipopolysaccharide transport system permease protein
MTSPIAPNDEHTAITYIRPCKGWMGVEWRELWYFRELFYTLTLRDMQVRYKQTIIGVTWAVIQPVLTMIVFSLFFGGLANVPTDDGLPYPIFTYAALVPWQFFASGVTFSANSIVTNANMIKKIYFPRLIIPISAILSRLVDFVLAFVVLLVMVPLFGIMPTANILIVPFLVLLVMCTTLGMSLWLSALNVQFRDIRYVIPFLMQTLMFVSPVAYPMSLIEDEGLRVLYSVNPMVGVIEGFRWALLGTDTLSGASIGVGVLVALVLLVSGLWYFKHMEKTFADVV